jgi:hypothetical protein
MDVAQPIWLPGCLKEDLVIAKNAFLAFFAIKRSSFGQPDKHMDWGTSISFASIYPINPTTNPWNFGQKILRTGGFENLSFLSQPFSFYFSEIFIFVSSPSKSCTNYGVGWLELNFHDNHGFQPKITHPKHSW